jgi:hypothetical protein
MSEVEKKSGCLALLRLRKSLTQNKVELLCRHGRRGDLSTTDDSEDANWIAKRHSDRPLQCPPPQIGQ